MDTTMVVIVALFAVVVIGAFVVFRNKAKVNISTPVGNVKIDASNEPSPPTPAVVVKDARSSAGGLVAEDNTGRGANVEKIEVKDDILVSSTPPKQDPKA